MLSRTCSRLIATGLGSGLCRYAPGTAGSLACLAIWSMLRPSMPQPSYLVDTFLVLAVTLAGFIAVRTYLKDPRVLAAEGKKKSDPQEVVIDEWAGLLLALIGLAPAPLWTLFLAFALFRIFDIIKPFPVSRAERLPGTWGIMLDDLLAGLYAFAVLRVAMGLYGW